MLTISNLSKRFGSQELFTDATLQVAAGERVGLIGRNGHGKTTLLRMILGDASWDAGEISLATGISVGYLEQHLQFSFPSVREEVAAALPLREGGWREDYKAERILSGLGFSSADFTRAPREFSGGYQVRVQLAKLLVSEPDLLLLDEPTNYLDIVSLRWLEGYLTQWPGSLMLITHDRRFMDRVVTHTALIHRAKIKKLSGNTSKIYEQVQEEEEIHARTVQNQEKRQADTLRFIERFRSKASKAKQVQSRVKALAREGSLEKLSEIDDLDFTFPALPFSGKKLMTCEGLSFGYGNNPDLFTDLTLAIRPGDAIAVIGPNGKGKSTLLEVLSGQRKARDGNLSFHNKCTLGYFGQTNIDRLAPDKTVEEEISAAMSVPHRARARGICGTMNFPGDLALKKTSVLSGGEKARVMLGTLLAKSTNLLFLDEPTNHLDLYSAESLMEALEQYPGGLVFVSHDEEIIERLAKRLIVFDGNGAEVWEGDYRDFLRRRGWANERDQSSPAETTERQSSISKKELRKERARITQERSSILKPLETGIASIEAEIEQREAKLASLQAELLELTKRGYGDDAVKLTREIASHTQKIDELFETFEELSEQADQAKRLFEQKLEGLT